MRRLLAGFASVEERSIAVHLLRERLGVTVERIELSSGDGSPPIPTLSVRITAAEVDRVLEVLESAGGRSLSSGTADTERRAGS